MPAKKRAAVSDAEAHYLNVDLDVVSRHDLAVLVAALESKTVALFVGHVGRRYVANFELAAQRSSSDPDRAVAAFAKVIAALPAAARRVWKQATSRTLDLGIQAARSPHQFNVGLRSTTLAAAAKLGADLAITVYAPYPRPRSTRRAGTKTKLLANS